MNQTSYRLPRAAFGLVLAALAILAITYVTGNRDTAKNYPAAVTQASTADQIKRGHYLVLAGNCIGCHTARGMPELAGGRVLPTAFGQFYTPNISPDVATGIGAWSADEFWRALHDGKGRDGQLLYPAFPYTEYTKVSRADADAMFAYLRSVPAVVQKNRQHALNFPYSQRSLLLFWRSWFFKPQLYQADAEQTAEWNRGAYLVQGLGHCAACHSARNSLGGYSGGSDAALAGAEIQELNWYATSLVTDSESGHASLSVPQLLQRLQQGTAPEGRVYGPMAEVVQQSLQHLDTADLQAMVVYLKSQQKTLAPPQTEKNDQQELQATLNRGEKIYHDNCVECHQAVGTGAAPAYPALAGSRLVNLASGTNITRIILNGGFAPATRLNPEPYGMPPFAQMLSSQDIADVANYVRNSWGNHGNILIAPDVDKYRGQASY